MIGLSRVTTRIGRQLSGFASGLKAQNDLQVSSNPFNFIAVKKRKQTYILAEGNCAGPGICPLSCIQAGVVVCIKQLSASRETTDRLRELGFCEQQRIKLLSRAPSLICQVCNARLALSEELAEAILVEPLQSAAL